MYSEHAIIDGILHVRTTPGGKWFECDPRYITSMLTQHMNIQVISATGSAS